MTNDYKPFMKEMLIAEVTSKTDQMLNNNVDPTVMYEGYGEDKNGYFYLKNNFAILFTELEERTQLFSIFPKRLLITADILEKEIERYKYSAVVTAVVITAEEIIAQESLYLFLERDILPILAEVTEGEVITDYADITPVDIEMLEELINDSTQN
jgi:hypothetical protein